MIGKTLGNYRIISELGKGGMGVVYKAEEISTQREVALKILPKQLAMDYVFLKRFEREAQSLSLLNHPHIVKVYGWGKEEGIYYLALEFIRGKSLEEIFEQEGVLPLDKVLDIIYQVAEALSYAHERGIIHRDIKPSNIMVSEEGGVKLTDFGIARMAQATRVTATGGVVGTPEYMSPEQTEGRGFLDERTDIYSLGVVMYEALSGRPPFLGDTAMAVMQKQRFSLPEPLRELNPRIPRRLEDMVNKMMEKDKTRRYPNARALMIEIQKLRQMPLLSEAVVEAPPLEKREVASQKIGGRNKKHWARWVGGILVLSVVLGGLYLTFFRKVFSPQKEVSEAETVVPPPAKSGVKPFREVNVLFGMEDFRTEAVRKFPLLKKEEKEEARIVRTIKFEFRNAGKHFLSGNSLFHRGDYTKAIEEYKLSLSILPLSVVWNNLGCVYAKLGQIEEAIKAYKSALAEGTWRKEVIYGNLGVAYSKKGEEERALLEYKEALRINPRYLQARFNLVSLYRKMGKEEEARRMMREFLSSKRSFPRSED